MEGEKKEMIYVYFHSQLNNDCLLSIDENGLYSHGLMLTIIRNI